MEDIIELYKLQKKVTLDGHVHVEVRKEMYGLHQAGLLAQQILEKRLGASGYTQSKFTLGFWIHKSRLISLSLVVDNFGAKDIQTT